MRLDNLPPLREVIQEHGLQAKKSLGQNFLLDLNITSKIARQAGKLDNQPVLEIGPGPGGLTRALLAHGAKVTAIEWDERCLPALEQISQHYPGKLHIIHADASKVDYGALFLPTSPKPKIIANLPYNIGTHLLINWLCADPWPPFYESMTLMFQKEVAQRIIAQPNTPAYGRLAVLAAWKCESHIAFDLPPSVFSPAPKVVSSVVQLYPKAAPMVACAVKLEQLTRAAFGQRRKMLRQSLKPLGGNELLAAANIDPTRRAEDLTLEEFIALARAL